MDQRRYKPEAPMCERITARCPATGEAIATEIACDSFSFARVPSWSRPTIAQRAACLIPGRNLRPS
jgi:hypothetical protein